MSPEQFQQELNRLQTEFKELFAKYAPTIAGKTAVSYFKKNFQNEAWGRVKWQEVKRRTDPHVKGAKATRKILTGETGDLARSIEIKSISNGQVVIWTSPSAFSKEPYGRVHNEGLRAGRGKGFIMPKRQFMGESEELNALIISEIERKLKQITKQ
ncbi:MAG: phage virion morphogenesis protein [Bacteroidales bacterium]|nr:phage virion morphogenesis protein [Bacteroidales bacterium]